MKKILKKLMLLGVLVISLTLSVGAAEIELDSGEAFFSALSRQLESRTAEGVYVFAPSAAELADEVERSPVNFLRRMASEQPDDGASGVDYNVLNIRSGVVQRDGNRLRWTFEYLTTAEQERELDAWCEVVMRELKPEEKTDYEIVQAVYEYVGTRIVYDKELQNISAYSGMKTGKMVCQGYALMMDKLLTLADIPCRCICGRLNGVSHAWNMVQLDGKWYLLDLTLDAAEKPGEAMQWNYFLKDARNFSDHETNAVYLSKRFQTCFPLAKTAYPLKEVTVQTQSGAVWPEAVAAGKTFMIAVQTPDDVPYTLVSTDPKVVSVSQDGTLTAHAAGECSIFIRTQRADVIDGMRRLSVLDLTKASGWAQDSVDAYFEAGYLPASLCTQFQKGISRAEMARLMYPLFAERVTFREETYPSFRDLGAVADSAYILPLSSIGLFDGTGSSRFAPHATVTREQAAKILVTAAEKLLGESLPDGQTAFADARQISAWAQPYLGKAVAAGILKGYADGRFDPHAAVTREQMICALERLYRNCL